MDFVKIQRGTQLLSWEHMGYLQDAPRNSIAGLLSHLTVLNPFFYVSGCDITETPNGSNADYAIEDGYVCFKGEILPVEAHTVTKTPTQVIYLIDDEVGIDTIPTIDLDGIQQEVMRHRTAKLQVATNYPIGGTYMPLDSPTRKDLLFQQLSGKVIPTGSILPYNGDLSDFDATGLGGGIMAGWAVCNGLNGTVDLRGMTPFGATNVPDSGAGPIYAGVTDTSDPGDQVGQDNQLLLEDNLPEHTHDYLDKYQGYSTAGSTDGSGGWAPDDHTRTTNPNTTAHTAVEMKQASLALVFIQSIS